MTEERVRIWRNKLRRLESAEARYFDSLGAIRELADFAVEHVARLDEKRSISFTFSADNQEEGEQGSGGFRKSIVGILRSAASELTERAGDYEGAEEAKITAEELTEIFRKVTDAQATDSHIEVAVERSRARTDLLLASLLISAVSDFEVLFSSVASFFFAMRPEALRAQDTKIAWSEIEVYDSLEDLRSHFIDERVNQLMWSGFDDWMRWLSTQLRISYEDTSMDPVATAEVFQRRHIMVHSGGIVSTQYLSKVPGASNSLRVGDRLTVDIEYLSSALDRLTVLGASIVYKISRKLCPENSGHEHIDREALILISTLLQNRRFAVVERIASIILPEMRHAYETLCVQVNRWIALKELLGKDAICEEVAAWDVSSLQALFELSKSILLDDTAAIGLAEKMIKHGELTDEMIDTWPLLVPIRKELRQHTKEASGDAASDEVEP